MKKFQWRLDKVLKIRKQQEDVVVAQLFEITKQAFSVRQNIMLMQAQIKSSAEQLEIDTDVFYRRIFADFAVQTEKKILKLRHKLADIEKLRLEKLNESIEARKARKSLEMLKEKAFAEYIEWSNKVEQNELDDITNTTAARKLMSIY